MTDQAQAPQITQAPAERPKPMPVHDESEFAQLLDSDRFAQMFRIANAFSESTLIPEVFQGKPANCFVALQMAVRLRVDPMMLMRIARGRVAVYRPIDCDAPTPTRASGPIGPTAYMVFADWNLAEFARKTPSLDLYFERSLLRRRRYSLRR